MRIPKTKTNGSQRIYVANAYKSYVNRPFILFQPNTRQRYNNSTQHHLHLKRTSKINILRLYTTIRTIAPNIQPAKSQIYPHEPTISIPSLANKF